MPRFLDVFQKRDFAVITAPASALEQLGQMLQPLLGQRAPALNDLPAALDVGSLCHEKVRKEENGRGRNGTNQFKRWQIFCGKVLYCPAILRPPAPLSTESAAVRGHHCQ